MFLEGNIQIKGTSLCQGLQKSVKTKLNKKNYEVGHKIRIYPNDPRKLTGCQYDSLQLQIALTPKRAGLVWTFFY